MTEKPRITIYHILKELCKYFTYILYDNHKYDKRHTQQTVNTLKISGTFLENDSIWWLSKIADTRIL